MGKHDLNQLIGNCYRTEWNGMDWNLTENETGERDRSMSDLDTSGRFWANGSGTFNDHNDYSMNFVVFLS